MKKILLIVAFFLLIPHAFSGSLFGSRSVTVDFDISSVSEITGDIQSATVNLTFFPKDYPGQEVLNLQSSGERIGDVLQFKFQNPKDKFEFGAKARVRTVNSIPIVPQKVNFPVEGLDESLLVYTRPSLTIDSNDEGIIKTASGIVEGEDDLYEAVFKLADWTKNNIKYNLSTLTADVSQKASWVLENKKGVCDELTSLFIAMLRSVGIPARFVSGISYTNSELFAEDWGPHGWAEVYFPQYGWIPFDVTYGEFGWVDPTHFKFKDSVDSDEPSTYYQWLGRNADIATEQLDIKTTLVEAQGEAKEPVEIEIFVLADKADFGSYNLVEASVENLNGFYYATELHLGKSRELEIIGQKSKSILLLPYEKKRVSWIIKISNDLDEKFSYTFPVIVTTSNNLSATSSFESNIRDEEISFSEVQAYANSIEEEKEKQYAGNVMMQCMPDKNEAYQSQKITINCAVKNTGNVYLGDANVCAEGQCIKTSLGISQLKNFEFRVNNSRTGARAVPVTLTSPILSKTANVDISVLDEPHIEILQVEHPLRISYKSNFTISFMTSRKSYSTPKDVEVTLSQNGREKRWNLEELDKDRKYIVEFAGKNLRYGENKYDIQVAYKDGLGNSYQTGEEFTINLDEATSFQKAALLFNRLDLLSFNSLMVLIFIVGGVFVITTMILFRKK